MSVGVVAMVRPSGVSASGAGTSCVRVFVAAIAPPVPGRAGCFRVHRARTALTPRRAVLSFRHLRVIDYAECARRGVTESSARRRLSGAQIVVEYLVRQGVPVAAGIPG